MASTVAEIIFLLRARDEASRTFATMGSTSENVISKMTTAALGLAKAMSVLTAGTIGFTVKAGMNFNSTLERSTLTIEHFFGKTEKTADMMKQLTEYAKNSAFGFAEVTDAAAKLAGFKFKQDEILPMLSVIADAAAGAGGDVNLITRALGQIKTSGRVYAQDMNQLANQNVNAWGYLAEAAGTSIEELRQKMAAGATIASEKALPIILAGMKKDFDGMQEAYQQSFKGKMERMKDTFAQFAGELTKPLFDKSKIWMDKLSALMNDPAVQAKIKKIVADVSSSIVSGFNKIVTFMQSAWPTIKQGFVEFVQILAVIGLVLKGVWEAIGPFVTAMLSAFVTFDNGKMAAAAFAAVLLGLTAIITYGLVAALIAAVGPLLGLVVAFAGFGAGIYLFVTYFDTAKLAIYNFIDDGLGSLVNAINSVLGSFSSLMSGIQGFFSGIAASISGFFGGILSSISGFFGAVGSAIASLGQVFAAANQALLSSLAAIPQSIMGILTPIIQLPAIVSGALIAGFSALAGLISGVFGSIVGSLSSLFSSIASAVASGLSGLANMAAGFGAVFVAAFISGFKEIFGFVANFIGAVIKSFGILPSEMLRLGKEAAAGFIKGFIDYFLSGIESVLKFPLRIVEGFTKILGISSPSKVMHAIGINTGTGFAQGLASTSDQASAAGTIVANAASGSLYSSAVSGAAAAGSAAAAMFVQTYIAGTKGVTDMTPTGVMYGPGGPDPAFLPHDILNDLQPGQRLVVRPDWRIDTSNVFFTPQLNLEDLFSEAVGGGGGGGGTDEAVQDVVDKVKEHFKDALTRMFDTFGPEVFTHWENGWKALIPLMQSSIETAADQINFDILFKQVFDSMEDTFGKEGANVMMAFTKALSDNSPQSAQALTSAVAAMVAQAEQNGVAGAAAMGAAIMQALAAALTEGTPEAIAAAVDAINALGTAIANAAATVKKTFGDTLSGLLKDLNDKRTYGSEGAGIMKLLGDEAARKSPEFEANVASAVAGMIDKLNNDFGAGGKLMGSSLIAALTTAIKDGTEASLAAVAAILADVNKLFEGGIVTNSGKVFDKDKVKEWSDILGDSSKRVLENIDLFDTTVFDDMVKNHKSLTDDQTKYLNGIIDAYKRGALTLEDAASTVQKIIENANKNNEPDEDKDGDGKPDSYQGGPGNANPDTLDVNAPSFWGTGSGRLGNLVTPSGLMVQVDQGILDGLREIMAFNTLSLLRPLDVMVGFFNRMSTGKDSLFGTSLDVVNNNLRGIHMTMDDIKGIFTKNKFEDLTGGERYWVALAKFGKDFVDHFTKLGISITDMFSLTQEEIDKWRNLTMDQIRADETLYKEWLAFQNKRHVNLGLAEGYLGMGNLPDIGVSLPYTYWNFQRDPTGSPPGVPISNSSLLGRGVNVTSPGITVVQQNNFHAADTEGMDRLVDGVAAKLANEISSMASTTDTFFSKELETPTWNKVKEGSIWQGEKKSGNSTFTAKEKTKLSFY